ncbi:MAG: VCBS repeat-containing protein [Ignavibacteria bacterium]
MNKITMFFTLLVTLLVPGSMLLSSEGPVTPQKVFTSAEIQKLAGVYIENNLGLKNPAIVDVDKDGDFDILIFNEGNVEYYKNTGTIEKPFFVAENMKYDKYNSAAIIDMALPYPVFFADKNGDSAPDMFVIKDKIFDTQQQKMEYKVLYADNVLGLDTGVLITIVLVLLIIVLVLAIL